MLQPKTPDERILVDTPVPTSSLLITQQPNVTKDQLKVSYGQLHYKIDYDFSANKNHHHRRYHTQQQLQRNPKIGDSTSRAPQKRTKQYSRQRILERIDEEHSL
ncbi:hypothetical protein AB6A40_011093 [Gnathostoma spinigerum]|uniref:Uncharacterized protein n=1 Tax=Gnathostoma spinigerum TaxID=75299 RepID=A0ABD6F145_9BILA